MGGAQGLGAAADHAADSVVAALLAASALLAGISERVLGEFDRRTTLTQFRTLAVLSRGNINLSRLASELGVNVSTAMRSIDRLIGFGYAAREENPHSRREVVLCLTPDGKRFVDLVVERRRSEIARLLARMSAQAVGELVTSLDAFVAAGGKSGVLAGRPA
ncbi:MAG TPA: MarR family transcriptional regulator [Mycobacteriales bacterium]|nr:MarR family transcriptional regulator [Mycobacteriales bacterium]